jgi:hypothetical protein
VGGGGAGIELLPPPHEVASNMAAMAIVDVARFISAF